MAQKYKLIERNNLGKDNAQTPRKFYAQAVNNGYVSFDELCEEIAEGCTLTSADVKATLDRMAWAISKNLQNGRIVEMGELGNFRMTIGSKGSITKEDFNTSLIKKPRVKFYPGKRIQTARTETKFERIDVNEEVTEVTETV